MSSGRRPATGERVRAHPTATSASDGRRENRGAKAVADAFDEGRAGCEGRSRVGSVKPSLRGAELVPGATFGVRAGRVGSRFEQAVAGVDEAGRGALGRARRRCGRRASPRPQDRRPCGFEGAFAGGARDPVRCHRARGGCCDGDRRRIAHRRDEHSRRHLVGNEPGSRESSGAPHDSAGRRAGRPAAAFGERSGTRARRSAVHGDRRSIDRRKGDARSADGPPRRGVPALWLRAPQGVRDTRASRSAVDVWTLHPSPAKFRPPFATRCCASAPSRRLDRVRIAPNFVDGSRCRAGRLV